MTADEVTRRRRGLRTMSPRRFVVDDRSMEPTLLPGAGLLAVPRRAAKVGELRCVQHPHEPDFWLVKRVAAVEAGPDGLSMWLVSDNEAAETVDSRTFGSVPVEGSYRVIVRIPARWM